jgi:hypothetical protein
MQNRILGTTLVIAGADSKNHIPSESAAGSDLDRSDIYRKTIGVTSHVTTKLRVKSAQGVD